MNSNEEESPKAEKNWHDGESDEVEKERIPGKSFREGLNFRVDKKQAKEASKGGKPKTPRHGAFREEQKQKGKPQQPAGVGFDVFGGIGAGYGQSKKGKSRTNRLNSDNMSLGANDSDLSSDECDNVDDCND